MHFCSPVGERRKTTAVLHGVQHRCACLRGWRQALGQQPWGWETKTLGQQHCCWESLRDYSLVKLKLQSSQTELLFRSVDDSFFAIRAGIFLPSGNWGHAGVFLPSGRLGPSGHFFPSGRKGPSGRFLILGRRGC